MPIYEYQCEKCRRLTSVLTMRVSERADAKCRHCGSSAMRRVMSRFATPRGEEARMDALADPSNFGDFDENDPKSVARLMRKMGREMGDEFAGDDFNEAVDEMEASGDFDGGGEDGSGGDNDDL